MSDLPMNVGEGWNEAPGTCRHCGPDQLRGVPLPGPGHYNAAPEVMTLIVL